MSNLVTFLISKPESYEFLLVKIDRNINAENLKMLLEILCFCFMTAEKHQIAAETDYNFVSEKILEN